MRRLAIILVCAFAVTATGAKIVMRHRPQIVTALPYWVNPNAAHRVFWYGYEPTATNALGLIDDMASTNDGTIKPSVAAGHAWTAYETNATLGNRVEHGVFNDGIEDYIDVGNPPDLVAHLTNGALTISAWYKGATTIGGAYKGLFTRGSIFSNDCTIWFGPRDAAPDQIVFSWKNGATAYGLGANDTNVFDGEWHHLAGVRDDSWDVWVYFDGVLLGTDGGNAAPGDNGKNIFVGYIDGPNADEDYLDDWNDDVQIYTNALTSNQVYTLYTNRNMEAGY